MKLSQKIASSTVLAFSLISLLVSTTNAQTNIPTKAQNRLSEAKMKVCQNFEKTADRRIDRLNSFAQNMFEKFDSIAMRVENYYTSSVLPKGKTVANYNSLVGDIASKKAIVQTALAKAQSDGADFSCNADSPRNKLIQYRTDMQAVKTDLKNYRTSIKNLIVAVHSVVGTENKLTPKPTEAE